MERLFLSRSTCHSRARLTGSCTVSPSRSCNSANVNSGCCRTQNLNCCSTPAVTLLSGPCRCSTRSTCPVGLRCAGIFHAYGLLTPNRSATSRRLPPPIVRLQQLPPQIVRIRLRHRFLFAVYRQTSLDTIYKNGLALRLETGEVHPRTGQFQPPGFRAKVALAPVEGSQAFCCGFQLEDHLVW